jgi:hypothetical protein
MARVLLLGEGDFTFTRALQKKHLGGSELEIVATSFDSHAEVVRKYPEVEGLLRGWKKTGEVRVIHGIDATQDLQSQIAARGEEVLGPFDTVIFNFPHLGVEDARLHGVMVAHVMSRARDLLLNGGTARDGEASQQSTTGGCYFILALADAQAARWHTNVMAEKNGMPLERTFAVRTGHWPGYEIRRHINGKSFKTRVDACSFLCYNVNPPAGDGGGDGDGGGANSNAVIGLLNALEKQEIVSPPLRPPPAATTTAAPATQPQPQQQQDATGNNTNKNSVKKKEKERERQKPLKGKRKIAALAEGHWKQVVPTTASTASEGYYQCCMCGPQREFRSEASVVAHVYNVHLLPSSSSSATAATATATTATAIDVMEDTINSISSSNDNDDGTAKESSSSSSSHRRRECDVCHKVMRDESALTMHMQAVHGSYEVLKPHWAASSASAASTTGVSVVQKDAVGTPAVAAAAAGPVPNPLFAALTAEEQTTCTVECGVCGSWFAGQAALEEHARSGFQPQDGGLSPALPCPHCTRCFKDQRALFQHMNLCKARLMSSKV